MSIKGLEQAIANLDSLDRNMVPNASAWAVNRVAANGVSVAVRRVAKETVAGDNRVSGIPVKLVRQRVRINKASASGHSAARIKVNRGNLPAIKLGAAQVRATNRKGPLVRKSSVLRIGRYVFRDAFIQRLANGRALQEKVVIPSTWSKSHCPRPSPLLSKQRRNACLKRKCQNNLAMP